MKMMNDAHGPGNRVSALPWRLYDAQHLGPTRGDERDGFFGGMLKDDLDKQRFAYDITLQSEGVSWDLANGVLHTLLRDFDQWGHGHDPVDLLMRFTQTLLEESSTRDHLLLELFRMPQDPEDELRSRRHVPAVAASKPVHVPSLGFVPGWSTSEDRLGVNQLSPELGGRSVRLPSDRLRRVKLRSGNRQKWHKVVRELGQVDGLRGIVGSTDRLAWPGYDVSHQVATQNLAIASTTAPIGWDARGTFGDLVTSPYTMFRQLRFVRFWVEAVEDAAGFLNTLTADADLFGQNAFTFSLRGIPSASDLGKAMERVRAGSLTVADAHNTYLYPRYA